MYIPVSLKNIDLTQAVLLSILIHGVFFISFDNNFIPKVQQDLEISFNPGIFEESNPKIKDQKVKLTKPESQNFLHRESEIAEKNNLEKQSLPPKKNYKSTKPGSSKIDQDKFLDLLSRHIAKFQRYPRLAQRRGWEGKTVLNIELTGTGDLISKNISVSSGFKILDNEAMKMIDRAMPLPVSSELLSNKILTIYIPIKFEIN
jgi:periplasmic protein TonB